MPETRKGKSEKPQSFEEYVKEHGEEEAVPFDEALRRLVNTPPKHKKSSAGGGAKRAKPST